MDDIAAVFETFADKDTKECLPLDRGSAGAAEAARYFRRAERESSKRT